MRWKRFVNPARTTLAPLGKPRAGAHRRRGRRQSRLKRPRRWTAAPAPVLHHVSFFYTAPLVTGGGDAEPQRMPDGQRPRKRAVKPALRLAA